MTETGLRTNAATARTVMRKGKSGAHNNLSVSSILHEPNWKSEGKGPCILQPIESASGSTEQVKKGWEMGPLEHNDNTLVRGTGARQRKGYTCEFLFSLQLQENYKRNFILRYNIVCNYMLDTLVY